MASPNLSYDIRFNGDGYEVLRTRAYLIQPRKVEVVGIFASRNAAEAEIKFQESLDKDAARDRAGR